ncbi:MAG: hypothetical protein AB7G48_03210 [Nitrospiraceae bacterium]
MLMSSFAVIRPFEQAASSGFSSLASITLLARALLILTEGLYRKAGYSGGRGSIRRSGGEESLVAFLRARQIRYTDEERAVQA